MDHLTGIMDMNEPLSWRHMFLWDRHREVGVTHSIFAERKTRSKVQEETESRDRDSRDREVDWLFETGLDEKRLRLLWSILD